MGNRAKGAFSMHEAKSVGGEGVALMAWGYYEDEGQGLPFAFAEAFLVLRPAPVWQSEPAMVWRRHRVNHGQAGSEAIAVELEEHLRRTWVSGQLAAHLHEWRKSESPQGPYPSPYILTPMNGAPSRRWLHDFISRPQLDAIADRTRCNELWTAVNSCKDVSAIVVDE